MINIFQPSLGDAELAAVAEVFRSNWLGRGARTQEFETRFANHLGVGGEHVTSANSCTEATFLAVELAGVGPGDEVVLPAVSFVGAANAVASAGARPVFCDVDPRTLNVRVTDLEKALTPRTKAVLLLHYGGYPGEVEQIAEVCEDRGVLLIEDAACAVASSVDGRACGTFGDMGVWSFDHGKVVVTVDGGMFYAKDPDMVAAAAKRLYFGLEQFSGFSQAQRTDARWWDFEVSSFSRRSITNDVLAAIGCVQMDRLPGFLRRRQEIVTRYHKDLADLPGVLLPPPLPPGHVSSNYLYWLQIDGGIRDVVAKDLYENGIYTTFRYPLLHRVAAYGAGDVRLPNAERAAEMTLCLPLHQALTDEDVDHTISVLHDAVTSRLAGARKAQS
ncbi:glutamine--scyllo-inositol aminotransferase [Actinosynnema sp. ALI-1.44]|uniref:DegT/DnrJ/EryC1/StrS family aminotransferase n=1 Tax=Actinosynnema sp. ALI-1.44 TaxID=1933779 RepID=UPI00097BDFA6|nr:DegT/DnrJ/EryC1/StrS family aminotransferase [Actinosynnema sp. ALI-1.44]ONI76348.1 glutamine--scyllo-inositol aminotransferase [Actinosynnema sp. ALI-1.44]